MNLIEEIAGELCKILLPIEDRIYFGNPKSTVAVCTLSSMKLLDEIVTSSLISKVNVVGRLLSENKGIDMLVRHVISNPEISVIILCGKDTVGHKPGYSLLCLHKNGIDKDGKIIGSQSPDPILSLRNNEVIKFQNQVKIIDRMGEINISNLRSEINKIQ
ncbi:MAG TPA: tetrahydromethanopterin S-methyltransferase subunit A [Candidatus Nitrosotalea sp.]|nr:tetrahydromethanopterin S-methyltransferase subunit A [Candidatus Nitrosotalea sp.]